MDEAEKDVQFVYNRFCDFFIEAVFFADQSSKEDIPKNIRSIFAKNSLLSVVFALESAANSLIDSLRFSNSSAREFDKLTILGKFQLFYMHRSGKTDFDKGCAETQAIMDLIHLRNQLVHSKLDSQLLDKNPDGTVRYPDINYTDFLKLPLRPYFLTHEHAFLGLREADKFLERFFNEWCRMDPFETSQKLLHLNRITGMPDFPMTNEMYRDFEDRFSEMGLRLAFLNHRSFSAYITHS